MRATLTAWSPLLFKPANSSMILGGCPAASTRTGAAISRGMAEILGRLETSRWAHCTEFARALSCGLPVLIGTRSGRKRFLLSEPLP